MSLHVRVGFFGLFCLAMVLGCGSTQLPEGVDNLRQVAIMYGRYRSANKGRPPADEAKFKEFIKKTDSNVKVDELFVSARDQQPIVVIYNLKGTGIPEPGKGAPVVAHEKTGRRGKIMIVRSTAETAEVDEAKLKELLK